MSKLKPAKLLSIVLGPLANVVQKRQQKLSEERPLYLRLSYKDIFAAKLTRMAQLDKEKQHLNLENFDRLNKKIGHLNQKYRRINTVNSIIIGVLFLTAIKVSTDVQFFGVTIGDLTQIRELLLFSSATLGIAAMSFHVASDSIARYLHRAVEVTYPEKFRELYAIIYGEHITILFSALVGKPVFTLEYVSPMKTNIVVYVWLMVFAIAIVLSFIIFTLTVHILVVVDIYADPIAPLWLNRLVILYTIVCDVSVLFFTFILAFPLRYRNMVFSNKMLAAINQGPAARFRFLKEELKKTKERRSPLDF